MSYQFEDMYSDKPEDKELVKQYDKAVSRAKQCLGVKEFGEYKVELEKVKTLKLGKMLATTRDFLSQDSGDMAFYGAKMLRHLTELKDLMVLLDAVESDIRKERHEDKN